MNEPRQAIPVSPGASPVRPAVGVGRPVPAMAPGTAPRPPQAVVPRPAPPPLPAQKPARPHPADDPIALVDDSMEMDELEASEVPARKITFGPEIGHKKHNWQRSLNATGAGASRVRSFHGKLSEQGLEYLDDLINEWLDAHPEIEVKFVTSTIGMFDGKMKDLAVILNVWF